MRPSWLISLPPFFPPSRAHDRFTSSINEKRGRSWLHAFFSPAFEYDGLQHDEFVKKFHETIEDFKYEQENDRKKDSLSLKYGTIVIRIGAHDSKGGCDYKTPQKMINALFEEIKDATGIDLRGKFGNLDKKAHDYDWWIQDGQKREENEMDDTLSGD